MSSDTTCTCHPDEAPVPCQYNYAFSECVAAAKAQNQVARLTERERELLDAAEEVLVRWAVARVSAGNLSIDRCGLGTAIKDLDAACESYPDEDLS